MRERIVILLRTSPETIGNVVIHAKYALKGELRRFRPGDIALIAQKAATVPDGKPIRYMMRFVRSYRDSKNESDAIWGRHWAYIIECRDCRPLLRPFNIRQIQVTDKNYAQGGTVVYVTPEDADVIHSRGYLDVTGWGGDPPDEDPPAAPVAPRLKAKKDTDGLSEEIRLLERIDQLRRSGAITVNEFNRLKNKILGT